MENLIFTTLAIPGEMELDALMMAESIRTFGGNLAANPIWVLVPERLGPLSESMREKLAQLKAKIIAFEIAAETLKFPFAAKIVAAALAEEQARGQTERLVFMDGDTIVLQEPSEFLIAANKALGYRPVHHKLIGSDWDQPPDSFWQLIYQVCEVPDENIFPMMTHAGERIRPYFNAGMFVIRPERDLLAQWRDRFMKYCCQPEFMNYYEQNQRYAIFIHQAVFTGVLLHYLKPEEMAKLSPKMNYPLHLHNDIPADQRPAMVNELISVRYENIFDQPDWQQLPIKEPLRSWLKVQPRVHASK